MIRITGYLIMARYGLCDWWRAIVGRCRAIGCRLRTGKRPVPIDGDSPVHDWFGLTYSSYLVLPRSLMEQMPRAWQRGIVTLVEQAEKAYDIPAMSYSVHARDMDGRFVRDPLANYRHPMKLKRRSRRLCRADPLQGAVADIRGGDMTRLDEIRNRLANAKCGGHRMVKCEVYTADVTLLLAALDDAAQAQGVLL